MSIAPIFKSFLTSFFVPVIYSKTTPDFIFFPLVLVPCRSHCSPPLHLFTVITSLIRVMPVNGVAQFVPPSLPSSSALPLVKLPVGYYRDVFINAVYDSLSALSLAAFTSSFSTPIFPFPSKITSFFISSSCLALPGLSPSRRFLSPSSVPSIRLFCPFSPFSLSKSHYSVNFVGRRCQRDLLCESHCTELIPNLPRCSNGPHSNSLPI